MAERNWSAIRAVKRLIALLAVAAFTTGAEASCLIRAGTLDHGLADALRILRTSERVGDGYVVGRSQVWKLIGSIPIPVSARDPIGRIFGAIPRGNASPLIVAEYGTFLVENPPGSSRPRFARQGPGGNIGEIRIVQAASAGRWVIGTERGLYAVRGGTVVQPHPPAQTGAVTDIARIDATDWLVGSEEGLFIYESRGGRVFRSHPSIARVNRIVQESSGTWLIASDAGLFRWSRASVQTLSDRLGKVYDVEKTSGGTFLIGTDSGLLELTRSAIRRVPASATFYNRLPTTSITSAKRDGTYFLSGTQVFRFQRGEAEVLFDWMNGIHGLVEPEDGTVWTISGNGLASATGSRMLFPVRSNSDVGTVRWVTGASESEPRLVNTTTGLFELIQDDRVPAVEVAEGYAERYTGGAPVVSLRWTTRSPCAFNWNASNLALSADGRSRWPLRRDISVAGERGSYVIDALVTIELPRDQVLSMDLYWRQNERSRWHRLNQPIRIKHTAPPVAAAARGSAISWSALLLALHTLFFGGSILLSRWSSRAWKIANDPIAGKMGLWFHFALRHFPPAQRWVLDRWFRRARIRLRHASYLPVTLTDSSGHTVSSEDWIRNLKNVSKAWIQGNSGMGKSALVHQINESFFLAEPTSSLAASERRLGFIPVVVSLRTKGQTAPDPGKERDWLTRMVAATLEDDGVEFSDLGLLRTILWTGNFCVILDGANETPYGTEIETLIGSSGSLRLVVTSQSVPAVTPAGLEIWRLPASAAELVEPMLCLYLGEEQGRAIYNQLHPAVISDLRSGYDIRLLVELAKARDARALPTSRRHLYSLIASRVSSPDGSPYPEAELAELAWQLWISGERQFGVEHVSSQLAEALQSEHNPVVRRLAGTKLEFRHDQMRGYLAARRLLAHTVNAKAILGNTPEVWKLAWTEQEVVWAFLADLAEPELAIALYRWSLEEPETRIVLQAALRRRLTADGSIGGA